MKDAQGEPDFGSKPCEETEFRNSEKVPPETHASHFADDHAIEHRDEDTLGRGNFVSMLARAVKAYKGKDSLIIGVDGEWGSGKTSIVNLLVEEIQAEDKNSVRIVNFNPWQWSSQNYISQALFEKIGSAFSGRSDGNGSTVLFKRWREYAKALRVGRSVAESVKNFAFVALLFIAAVGLVGTISTTLWIKGVATLVWIAFTLLSILLKTSEKLSDSIAKWFKVERLDQIDLDGVKKKLKGEMEKLQFRILIVLDDIDRLTKTETRNLLTLVKANADFPNLIYLMMMQRDIVESHLNELVGGNGREFLKKIVQVPFTVPIPERHKLDDTLTKGIHDIMEGHHANGKFDERRWLQSYAGELSGYFRTLRDVKRFLNVLEFTFGAFDNGEELEVNPTDLVFVEIIMQFEPEIYAEIPQYKEYLTGQLSGQEILKDEFNKAHNAFKKLIGEGMLRGTVSDLFPATDTKESVSAPYMETFYRESRVCHPDFFDRYFMLRIGESEISNMEIARMLSISDNRQLLLSRLKKHLADGKMNPLLNSLNYYRDNVPGNNSVPYLSALCDVSDELPSEYKFSGEITSLMYLGSLFDAQARKNPQGIERDRLVSKVFESSDGLVLPSYILQFEDRRRLEKLPDKNRLITNSTLDEEIRKLADKISKAAKSYRLEEIPYLYVVLANWRRGTSSDIVKRWVSDTFVETAQILDFLTRVLGYGRTGSRSFYFRRDLGSLNEIADLNEIYTRLEGVSSSDLPDLQKEALEAFREAMDKGRGAGGGGGGQAPGWVEANAKRKRT